jgi:hypothetical protein
MLCDCSQIKAARKPLNGVEDSSVRVWRVGGGVRVKGQGSRVGQSLVLAISRTSLLPPSPSHLVLPPVHAREAHGGLRQFACRYRDLVVRGLELLDQETTIEGAGQACCLVI